MYTMLKNDLANILDDLGKSLDISQTEYDAAVTSYMAVGTQLSKEGSILAPFKPEILPQGSFLLGTTTKPVNESDDLDIDLVCQLRGKSSTWSQYELKQKVGQQLKDGRYKDLIEHPDGRRCWTLRYRENSDNKYHMDILPCIVDSNYRILLENAFASNSLDNLSNLAIRITDKTHSTYYSDTNHLNWLKSNPFGYSKWFFNRAYQGASIRAYALKDSIQPVPKYQSEKLPLQRIVQILKRHRDIKFSAASKEEKENKPISIIITTLAAKSYQGEQNVVEALQNVVSTMARHIADYNPFTGQPMKWIANPVNPEENFADRWVDPATMRPNKKQTTFYTWLNELQKDIQMISQQTSRRMIIDAMQRPFGGELIRKNFARELGIASSTFTLSGSAPKGVDLELPSKLPQPKREGFQ